jgi:hypothetical protein
MTPRVWSEKWLRALPDAELRQMVAIVRAQDLRETSSIQRSRGKRLIAELERRGLQ